MTSGIYEGLRFFGKLGGKQSADLEHTDDFFLKLSLFEWWKFCFVLRRVSLTKDVSKAFSTITMKATAKFVCECKLAL